MCMGECIERKEMWLPNSSSGGGNGLTSRRSGGNGLVAVAIDKDKGSQYALKWAADHLLSKGQTIVLIHVLHRSSSVSSGGNGAVCDFNGALSEHKQQLEKETESLFLTFHCYCTRKDLQCLDIVLEDTDVAKAINEYVSQAAVQNLVLGASRHGFIRRLKTSDVPSNVMKGAPDFCTVYVISKTKISSVRNASRPAPFTSPLLSQIQKKQSQATTAGNSPDTRSTSPLLSQIQKKQSQATTAGNSPDTRSRHSPSLGGTPRRRSNVQDDRDLFRSPFTKGRGLNGKMFGDLSESDTDISFVSSDRPSTDRLSSVRGDSLDYGYTPRLSTSSKSSFESMRSGTRTSFVSSSNGFSSSSLENDDVEAEMRRLKLELQKTMELYSTACKEALSAKQKTVELHRWRLEEERRLEEAQLAEEAALVAAGRENAKHRAAIGNADAAKRIAELESQRRINTEMELAKKTEEKQKVLGSLSEFRYRRYTIDEIEQATDYFAEARKIGEGGYGPVFKCYLDHTPVAVKVLRPDAVQGRSQFNQEVEVLSCMRHPNLVLLLGACPEYGCLVYEYMAKGCLEDRLFRKGNTPALTWQYRFHIAAEIATGLLFLHSTKPEPLVHRDLKPGNILLDQNYVSKIGDVGLARLVPPSVCDEVTQYRLTSAAGTFCYIDPEYQQTGMLGVKSDVYSLGIMFLQLITGKPAMGLTYSVSNAIENGTFAEILDPALPDWPVEEALCFAKLALQCAELRRKDRPDLGKVVLPELNRLREFADENMCPFPLVQSAGPSPSHSQASLSQGASSGSQVYSGENISKNHSSTSLPTEEKKVTKFGSYTMQETMQKFSSDLCS